MIRSPILFRNRKIPIPCGTIRPTTGRGRPDKPNYTPPFCPFQVLFFYRGRISAVLIKKQLYIFML